MSSPPEITYLRRAYAFKLGSCMVLFFFGLFWLLYVTPRAGEHGGVFLAAGVLFMVMGLLLLWVGSRWLRTLLAAYRAGVGGGAQGGNWTACEFYITAQRSMDATRYSAQVTDVASQARWHLPLLNAHSPGAEINLAIRPGRVLYAHGAPGAAPYPVAVQADGMVYWAAGRAALVVAS
jgi:hypothetical protein